MKNHTQAKISSHGTNGRITLNRIVFGGSATILVVLAWSISHLLKSHEVVTPGVIWTLKLLTGLSATLVSAMNLPDTTSFASMVNCSIGQGIVSTLFLKSVIVISTELGCWPLSS